ncbi:16S rRNA (cytosine(967)-C(5))-methyltransferase RsmB [bacterium]|nr:16S rRNA (cytosine(967)-C(5))-methyltransferase RsmB [bacterium]
MEKSLETRWNAFKIISSVLNRKNSSHTLLTQRIYNSSFSETDRRFIVSIVNGTLKNLTLIDHIINSFKKKKKPIQTEAMNLLRMATYQILFLDKTPAYAIIDTSVKICKKWTKDYLCGFINATLRNIAENHKSVNLPSSKKEPLKYLSIRYSHPEWLLKRWLNRIGYSECEKLCALNNASPPLSIRINLERTTPSHLLKSLKSYNLTLTRNVFFDDFYNIEQASVIPLTDEFHKGLFTIQDPASKLPVLLLDPRPGERILEICAFPGGKLTHISQFMREGEILLGIDSSVAKIEQTMENINRMTDGFPLIVAADGKNFTSKVKYDKILVDATCSGLGVLRRYPEAKLFREEKDIFQLAQVQKQILTNTSNLLKDNGILVYSTCTTEPEENEEQVRFLVSNGFNLVEPPNEIPEDFITPEGCVSTFPLKHNFDGSFCAKLTKVKGGIKNDSNLRKCIC